MKGNSIIIAVCIVAICVFGWFTVTSQIAKESSVYADYIKEADDFVARGLYQRAINSYNVALDIEQNEDVYLKTNVAYTLRYQEEPKQTIRDYMNFLKQAVTVYPGNQTLVDNFVDIYYIESKYEDIYNCLVNAIDNGYDSEEVRSELRKARYAFKLRRSEFSELKQSTSEYYSVGRNNSRNIYTIEDGYLFSDEYDYVSCVNDDKVIVTGKDSRILDTKGMVYGIFKGKVTDASLFSENLVAACVDGVYSYYNDLADKQFGEYEMAGSFQNGKAAVKKDGKWMLIDNKGNVVSDVFEEIVVDDVGNFLVNNMMIAKVNGVYGLYDDKLKLKSNLEFSDVDILTKDEIIAVAKDGKWGFVKTDGKTLVEPIYQEARSFSNGLAAVKKDDKWGFIDVDGNLVIDCQFSDARYMSSKGICPVRTDMPEEKIDSENSEEQEFVESTEIWKMMELEIGIKEK